MQMPPIRFEVTNVGTNPWPSFAELFNSSDGIIAVGPQIPAENVAFVAVESASSKLFRR